MKDIVDVTTKDLVVFESDVPRATNILSVQLGSLEYAKDLGIDLAYFLQDTFRIQTASFKSYLIETLANRGINVASVLEIVDLFSTQFIFEVGNEDNGTGLIAR